MSKTLFNKNVAQKIKKTKVSRYKARKLQKAIIQLDQTPVDVLCKTGRAFKINTGSQTDLYAYRVGVADRIIFTASDGQKIVHDIIDTDTIGKASMRGKK